MVVVVVVVVVLLNKNLKSQTQPYTNLLSQRMEVLCDKKLVAVFEVPRLSDGCETFIFKSKSVHRRSESLTSLL